MSASLSGVFNVAEWNDLGDPLVMGRLYTWAPNTTTLKIAYTDAAGAVPHTYTSDGMGGQYIALDARGELPAGLFLLPGGYDLALKTPAGATIWTRRASGTADQAEALANPSGAGSIGFQQSGAGTVSTTVEQELRSFIRVEQFGVVPGLDVSQTVRLANMINFQKALDEAEKTGQNLLALAQYYALEGDGLMFGDAVGLIGSGVDQWEPVILAPQRTRGWRGTNLVFFGTGTKRHSLIGITSMARGGGWRTTGGVTYKLTSFMNADSTGSAPATPRMFSAAITNKRDASHIRMRGIRVVPAFQGTGNAVSGYDEPSRQELGANWDFGIWLNDSENWDAQDIQAVGYWREAGRAITTGAWYEFERESRGERNSFRHCRFQGRVGTMIRTPDRWKVLSNTATTTTIPWTNEQYFPDNSNFRGSNNVYYTYTTKVYDSGAGTLTFQGVSPDPQAAGIFHVRHRSMGIAGSSDFDVYNYDLYHQSRVSNATLGLANGSGMEFSGYPLRGYQFYDTKYHVLGPVKVQFHDCADTFMFGPQFEGGTLVIASDSDANAAAYTPDKAGDTRNLRLYSDVGLEGSEIDLTLFTPRSVWADGISATPRGYLQRNMMFTPPLPLSELVLRSRTGDVTRFENKDGATTVAVISDSGRFTLAQGLLYLEGTNRIEANGNMNLNTSGVIRLSIFGASGNIAPGADNVQNLGTSGQRWATVFAGTGTINTSDARAKQQVREILDAERAVALRIKGLLRAYKFNDAVEAKGEDARIHFGVIAQDVVAAFSAEGLDATQYALLCYDEWGDEFADEIETRNVLDGNGQPTGETQKVVTGQTQTLWAGNRYGIRYDELLAFIISAL